MLVRLLDDSQRFTFEVNSTPTPFDHSFQQLLRRQSGKQEAAQRAGAPGGRLPPADAEHFRSDGGAAPRAAGWGTLGAKFPSRADECWHTRAHLARRGKP